MRASRRLGSFKSCPAVYANRVNYSSWRRPSLFSSLPSVQTVQNKSNTIGVKQHISYSNERVPLTQLSESFLDGTSAQYVDDMYATWQKDPSSVHVSWNTYFTHVEKGAAPGQAHRLPPTLHGGVASVPSIQTQPSSSGSASYDDIRASMRVLLLIRAYQVSGHLAAKVNPLTNGAVLPQTPTELLPSSYGFTEADMDKPIFLGETNLISGFLRQKDLSTLRDLMVRLEQTYCGAIGVEYMHISDRNECNWIRERIETPVHYSFSPEDRLNILDRLTWSSLFEQFLATKYVGAKRFGLEGCEVLIPGMKSMVDRAAQLGAESVVIGMPHRGRLNVLANVVRKPLAAILHEFDPEGVRDQHDDLGVGSGDVKYHLGTSYDRPTRTGQNIHLSLVANPSHLEAVNPVVIGKSRAKQYYSGDTEHHKVIPVLLHGDAAFCGQGISYETFDMCLNKSYHVGGTIHIIVNNQVGFTTDTIPDRVSTASRYATDVAKTAGAPIFHVNGDDPEAVVFVMNLAAEYRQAFKKDCVVDIFCYRKEGHNEMDEPSFTQPLMYKLVTKHTPVLQLYAKQLNAAGVCDNEKFTAMKDKVMAEFNEVYGNREKYRADRADWLSSTWTGFKDSKNYSKIKHTGISKDVASKVGEALGTVPENFKVHRKLAPMLKKKLAMAQGSEPIDWATAEAFAFGSLLAEGTTVRLSGQDVQRGTFSHRHSVLHDSDNGSEYTPLNHISENQQKLQVCNSTLSEYGVLGFELGFSLENPNALILWEAQFGDFANGAQVIFDQFLSAGEQKWFRQTGLVVLLPHGYDGQGPEHSSGRMERFLQMVDQDPDLIPDMGEDNRRQIQMTNMQIVNCSTPANYFHALRRQIHREFRKPLVIFSPKRLLKLKEANSNLDEFLGKTRFQRVISETSTELKKPEEVRKLIFCSGNVYYDLISARSAKKVDDVAIVRVEQLAPTPFDRIEEEGKKYPNAKIVWVQEEPKNMGAWNWMYHNLKTALKSSRGLFEPEFVGRAPAASPATGSGKAHKKQLNDFLSKAFA